MLLTELSPKLLLLPLFLQLAFLLQKLLLVLYGEQILLLLEVVLELDLVLPGEAFMLLLELSEEELFLNLVLLLQQE